MVYFYTAIFRTGPTGVHPEIFAGKGGGGADIEAINYLRLIFKKYVI